MDLQYLDFESSEEADGAASFDALATVPLARWAGLAAEVSAVLAWAQAEFGAPASLEEGGAWDLLLHGSEERATPLTLHWDAVASQLRAQPQADTVEPRRTLGLTLSCTADVADAFRQALLG